MSTVPATVDGVSHAESIVNLPRVAIRFCTKCKWNLRAAYYAQELLQTFDASIGEISLIPVTGGIFEITVYHVSMQNDPKVDGLRESTSKTSFGSITPDTNTPSVNSSAKTIVPPGQVVQSTLIWERKRDGGFPETKELKNRVRNVIDPQKDMGHIDRSLKKKSLAATDDDDDDTTQALQGTVNVSSGTEERQATGGESQQFGSNVESSDAKVREKENIIDQMKGCEDCK